MLKALNKYLMNEKMIEYMNEWIKTSVTFSLTF